MTAFLEQHGLKLANNVLVMGILNVTPNSFSDGGRYITKKTILARAEEMVEAGADILDIGGESTRPFAEPITEEEEIRRVIPAIRRIRRQLESIPISIDTTKAEVARQACDAGATIINDISALRSDPGMADVAQEFATPVIIMHMLGSPQDMQDNPVYSNVVTEIIEFLHERLAWLADNGIPNDRVIIDPGIGFGKNVTHNLAILNHLDEFKVLGCPILVGHSRKSFIKKILGLDIDQRDIATAAVSAICVAKGAKILRVHDVESTLQATRLTQAIIEA